MGVKLRPRNDRTDLRCCITLIIMCAVMVTLCSMTSFLFPYFNRFDQNIFFTVGRGILNGKVPYRDYFDQKGPYIFILHAVAGLFSTSSFVGVYILQMVAWAVIAVAVYKTARLYLHHTLSFTAAALTMGMVIISDCYVCGDNVEEFAYPLIAVSIALMLSRLRCGGNPFSASICILNGAFFGLVFWTKFTLVGFWVAWCLFAFIMFVRAHDMLGLIKVVASFLVGFSIVTLPIFIYFTANNALGDLMYCYFYSNITYYPLMGTPKDQIDKLYNIYQYNISYNPTVALTSLLGVGYFIVNPERHRFTLFSRLFVGLSFVCTYFVAFYGGRSYYYYFLIMAPFCIFGMISAFRILEWGVGLLHNITRFNIKWLLHSKIPKLATVCIVISVTMLVTILGSNCRKYFGTKKEDYAQYHITEIIKQKENATLLNYKFLDGGFYLYSGCEPINRFFCTFNIPRESFPEIYDEPEYIVKNGLVDFVVIKNEPYDSARVYTELAEHYEFVTEVFDTSGEFGYKLYILKSNL